MADAHSSHEPKEFPSTKSRSSSPIQPPEEPENKLSRKREREISLEPSQSISGESDQTKSRKDSAVPAKKNRTCDSPLQEETSSGSESPSGSPKSPPQEVKIKVNEGDPPNSADDTPKPPQTADTTEPQPSEPEKGVKRKFLERGTSAGPQDVEGATQPAQEGQKRLRDDPDGDPNPRETKRPTPPPESQTPPRRARSPPPSPKRPATGFAAYSGSKSPFSKAKGNSIFGKNQAKAGSGLPSFASASQATPSFALAPSPNDIPCSPNDPPPATPAKRSGFDAFIGSTSPFATFARSKSPVLGSSSPKSAKRNSTPTNASAFSTYASGGAQAFTLPSAKRARADSPSRSDDSRDKGESSTDSEEKPGATFGEKLRAGKDDDANQDPAEEKPIYQEQEVTTGEEGENTVHQVRGKLFALVDNQWKERGVGQLKLNVSNDGSSSRLVMRKEAVHTLLLNVLLFPGMKCVVMQDPRYLRFSSLENGHVVHYNLKVSSAKIAQDLLDEITIHTPEGN